MLALATAVAAALLAQAPPPADASAAPAEQPPEAPPEAPPEEVVGVQLLAIEFVDRIYFKEETLKSYMVHPVPGTLDEDVLRADAVRMETQYKDRGYLNAHVALELVPAELGGVRGVFRIKAGDRAELKRVKIVGNAR